MIGVMCGAGVLVKHSVLREELEKQGYGARKVHSSIGDEGSDNSADHLLLLDEEALYLARNGRLTVENYTLEDLWKHCTTRSIHFASKYSVFQFYKDKGYVLRTGINFGVDYCIYQSLPSECHSEMLVTVVDGWSCSNSQSSKAGNGLGQVSWRHVSTLTRVAPDVMKLCVLCYVLPKAWRPPTTSSITAPMGTSSSSTHNPTHNQSPANSDVHSESPYLAALFPHLHHQPSGEPSSTTSTTTTTVLSIDTSTSACLDQLTVHPVTALVRRQPAFLSTYQTVGQLQAQYQSTATAQKKRENKLAGTATAGSARPQTHKRSNTSSNGGHSSVGDNRQSGSNSKTGSSTAHGDSTVQKDATVTNSADQADQEQATGATCTATDGKPLSGRQKRVAKYLAKEQAKLARLANHSGAEGGQSGKARRDHREIRSKAMSGKNQALLDALGAGGGGGGSGGGDAGNTEGCV